MQRYVSEEDSRPGVRGVDDLCRQVEDNHSVYTVHQSVAGS